MIAEIEIRVGELRDTEVLAEFNIAMASETEGKPLDRDTVMAGVRGLFDHPDAGFYVVAQLGSHVVGSLMVTYEWSDWRNGRFWWIQSVYVAPPHRRRGVFKQLYSRVKELAAAEENVCGLRLYVEQHNEVAQATYKSLGMDETHYDMFEVEFD